MVARALSSSLCATLATATLATSVPTVALAAPLTASMAHLSPESDAPASVLGLDSKDTQAASKLTGALRKAFANRGLSGGEEISLEEMRLTMGCSNDGVSCLAEGGKTLGVRRLVFGYLAPSGSGYQLDIQILDVDAASLEAQASMEISKGDLKDSAIEDTAVRIVNELMPPQEADADLPPRPDPLPEVEPEPEPEPDEPDPPREGGVWFGLEKPTPRWKWAAFGTSLALTVAAAGVTIGTGVWLTSRGSFGFRNDLLEAAAATQDKPEFNRVPTTLPSYVNLCDYNRHNYEVVGGQYIKGAPITTPDGQPGARDQKVADICTKGKNLQTTNTAFIVATSVLGLTTLVFTGVLLLHRKNKKGKSTDEAFFRRRGLSLGVAPRPEGGVTFGGGLRF